jgi:hypothetical protein
MKRRTFVAGERHFDLFHKPERAGILCGRRSGVNAILATQLSSPQRRISAR